MLFQTAHITPACIPVFRDTNARVQAFWKYQPDAAAAAAGTRELARFLPVLDSALDGRQWLEGEFSLADIAYAPHFLLIAEGGFDFSPYPHLQRWLTRLLQRPAWKQTVRLLYEARGRGLSQRAASESGLAHPGWPKWARRIPIATCKTDYYAPLKCARSSTKTARGRTFPRSSPKCLTSCRAA